MCANYIPTEALPLAAMFQSLDVTFDYRAETYPGYDAPVLHAVAGRPDELLPVRATFGLIPPWSKDTKISRMTYNARAETIAEKASYKRPWAKRQFCLVPVQAFYEPCYESGKAERWAIQRADGSPFALAAIWEHWKNPEGAWQRSFSMVTINATGHPLMQRFHAPEDEKRSVVVVPPGRYRSWLAASTEDEARDHLRPFDADQFTAFAAPRPPAKRKQTPAESSSS